MKKLLTTSIYVFTLLGLVTSVKGQNLSGTQGILYSVGVESGISSGHFNKSYRWNIGGSLQADLPVADNFFVTVNAGYLNFYNRSKAGNSLVPEKDIHFLPVMAGLKYFPIANWYIQGDAGAGFVLNKKSVGYSKSTAFLYTPQVGVLINTGGRNYIDAGVRYEATSKYITSVKNSKINFFELRIAYAFNTK
jgi:hypothetical protein